MPLLADMQLPSCVSTGLPQELLPPLWCTEMPLVRVIVDMEAAGLGVNEGILEAGEQSKGPGSGGGAQAGEGEGTGWWEYRHPERRARMGISEERHRMPAC